MHRYCYIAGVFALIILAFDFGGSVSSPWISVLIASTLPLSVVSLLGTWSLIHGAQLEGFAVFYFWLRRRERMGDVDAARKAHRAPNA